MFPLLALLVMPPPLMMKIPLPKYGLQFWLFTMPPTYVPGVSGVRALHAEAGTVNWLFEPTFPIGGFGKAANGSAIFEAFWVTEPVIFAGLFTVPTVRTPRLSVT